jgi:queuosine precursor transporter
MEKKEKYFLILSSLFITSLIMANILGISKFFEFMGLMIPVGIIPYPVTFLVTDIVSEVYGKKRANYLVLTGFFMNIFLVLIMTLGFYAPMDQNWLTSVLSSSDPEAAMSFDRMYGLMIRGTVASMVAYLTAQFIDVHFFHFLKEKTKGKHLWLRNNASTIVSQLVDTTAVIFITFYGILSLSEIINYIFYGYIFKFCFALIDTPLFYLSVKWFKKQRI